MCVMDAKLLGYSPFVMILSSVSCGRLNACTSAVMIWRGHAASLAVNGTWDVPGHQGVFHHVRVGHEAGVNERVERLCSLSMRVAGAHNKMVDQEHSHLFP